MNIRPAIQSNKTASINVCEIFSSVQGETSMAGRPAVFIRLSGCNLQCSWCDTDYAASEGTRMCIEDVVSKALSFKLPLAVITGGEPLLQIQALQLIDTLCSKGLDVVVETNGSIDISSVNRRARIIMDFKTPSSGQSGRMKEENLKKLREKDEIKFVVADRNDFEWAKDIVSKHSPAAGEILLSPVSESMDFRRLCRWAVERMPGARVQANLHKVFGLR